MKNWRQFEDIYRALEIFKSLHGHVKVPRKYIIGIDDVNYAEDMRGYRLGACINNIRCNEAYAGHKDQLIALGVDFAPRSKGTKENKNFENVFQTLAVFKAKFGHTNVPRSYVVPVDDLDYPEVMRGCHLGLVVWSIRWHKSYGEHKNRLINELGFDYTPRESRFDNILLALEAYKRLFPDHKRVPFNYVVPHEADAFPVETWGLKLGSAFANMINRNQFKKYHDRVIQLGYSLSPANNKTKALGESDHLPHNMITNVPPLLASAVMIEPPMKRRRK